ncbi:MAG: ABC transporter substrate-binding protein [Dehalococcoidia bacterium]|nr:ABC transporter substrate-binding protein [Dehalococcoidia bacterium]
MNSRLCSISLIALFAVIAAFSLVACGADSEPAEVPSVASSSAPPPTPAPEPTPVPEPTSAPPPSPTAAPAVVAVPTATSVPEPTATAAPVPTATTVPTPTAVPYPAVAGIVDPSNRGWPREIETPDGVIVIEEPPQSVLSYSLGHDEMVLAMLSTERVAAVGKFTADPAYSNIAEFASSLPIYEKGVENVLAAAPDLVIVSKYTDADIVDLIEEAGVTVVRPALESSAEGNIPNILLIGYMLGVEERALELAADIENRLSAVNDRVPPPGDDSRPVVLALTNYSDKIYAAGESTTEGGIIVAGGGVNAAAEEGLSSHQEISIESIAAMDPDVILVTQPPAFGGIQFRDELLSNAVLAAVPAVADGEVHLVDSRRYTTLSHWNVRGIENTALLLYPDLFSETEFADFEPYAGQ